MPDQVFIGLDPGVSGGIAVLDQVGAVVQLTKMPETPADLLACLKAAAAGASTRAVLERVNAGVFGAGKGEARMGVVSAFTFGRGVGYLEMALLAAGITFEEIAPAKWQTVMGCRSKGDKNITKRRAQQLFPTVKVTHAIADALLLAEYCRRLEVRTAAPLPDAPEVDAASAPSPVPAPPPRSRRTQRSAADVALLPLVTDDDARPLPVAAAPPSIPTPRGTRRWSF